MTSYDEDAGSTLLHKTSKNGKVTYLNIMLEAKLVTPEGFCLSLASEPLTNEEIVEYEKQDCEISALKRLAKKLKSLYPRLPICILADALYANQSMFSICSANEWKFIITFKDGQLKSLQTEITDTAESARIHFEKHILSNKQQNLYKTQSYRAIEALPYNDFTLNWIECIESSPLPVVEQTEKRAASTSAKFVYLTNISLGEITDLKQDRIVKLVKAGRCRWEIENEGFQHPKKNQGYQLHHKFCPKLCKNAP